MTIITRKKYHEEKQKARKQLISQRERKLAAARICYTNAKMYHEDGILPGVMYWEQEYRRLVTEAAAISRA